VPVNPSIILTVSLVFRIERGILALVASAPSSDAQARAVAVGSSKDFAVWRVAERTATQLLMCDRYESTRSRFVLQFGSAVAVNRNRHTGVVSLSAGFRLLMGFHVAYSKALLRSTGW
jgi:hypothetical protein